MIRLLKADIYKMFRMPSFWITTLAAWGIHTLESVACFHSAMQDLKDIYIVNYNVQNLIPDEAKYLVANSIIYLAIFVIIFVASEFSTGTIKNIATKGFMREELYFSKFICSIIAALISMAGSFGLTYAVGAIMIGNEEPEAWDIPENFVRNLLLVGLTVMIFIILALMIAFIVRSTGASLGIFLIYYVIFEELLFDKVIPTILKPMLGEIEVMPYSIQGCLNPNDDLTRGLVVAFAYIIGLTLIGLITFRKRDIN